MDSSPLEGRLDVISDILRYCPENDFIFLAGVSKAWRAAWFAIGGKQKSSVRLAVATQARARWVLSDPAIQNAASRLGGTLCLTAWAGNLAGLQAAAREIGPTWADSGNARWVTKMAAAGGSLETLQWARSQGCPWDADTVRAAAVGGHLGVLRWATREGCPWDYSADIASEDPPLLGGHQGVGATLGEGWAVLELTREQGQLWNPSNEGTCACAASSGHVQVLEWARAQGCGWNERTCSLAAGRGHLSVLKWARMRGCPWDATACSLAAGGGHLDTLQWAREHGCPWDETTCGAAAEGGHLDALKWARANGCPWDETTSWKAAGGGHLVVLRWARANGCTWDESTCSEAAAGGHLGVLQWVRAQGCAWDESTCSGAAAGGHLGVLQWAREQGCPWDETTCLSAAMFGHLGVLRWAREQGCPGNLDVCAAIAKRYRNPEVTSWIKAQNKFDHVWFLIRCALVALLVTLWCRYYPQSNTIKPAA